MTKRLESEKKLVGAKQVKRALLANQIDLVYIALDAERKVTDDIEKYCLEKKIQVLHVDSMEKLGQACKIDISAATAAILK